MAGQVAKYSFEHEGYGLVNLFYVDREGNIPTFFSASLLLLASLLLVLIAVLKKKSHDNHWPQWTILSLALLYMAVDEASGIHELLEGPGKRLLGQRDGGDIFHFAWIIFGMAFAVAFVLSYLKFFFHLPSPTQRRFFAAGTVFLSGALGVELLGSYYASLHGVQNFQYSMLAAIEESLEMTGVIIFINALLKYLIDYYKVRLYLDNF
ncbi:MAG: hypothetical protein AABY61_16750 [Nitrospirota bacterium]